MDSLLKQLKELKITALPPALKICSKCKYNIGNEKTGLCATCDPDHRWWK